MSYTHYIGIDTGTNTGFAVWNKKEKNFTVIKTHPIHIAMSIIKEILEIDKVFGCKTLIIVEDARLRSGSRNPEIAQGVGSVKRDSSIWDDYLKYLGADYKMVKPRKGLTKWDIERFKKLTGWEGKVSSHAIDAAMLVYGY